MRKRARDSTLKIYLGPQGRQLKRDFRRAAQLRGSSMNGLLVRFMRRVAREEQSKHPAVFDCLTDEEDLIVEAIEEQCHEIPEIADYTGLPADQVSRILSYLVDRRILEMRTKGGRVDRSRGAGRIDLYFLTSEK